MQGLHLKHEICRQALGESVSAWRGVTKGWRKVVRQEWSARLPALTMGHTADFAPRDGRFRIFSSHHLNKWQKGLAGTAQNTFLRNQTGTGYGLFPDSSRPFHSESRWQNFDGVGILRELCWSSSTGLPEKLSRRGAAMIQTSNRQVGPSRARCGGLNSAIRR